MWKWFVLAFNLVVMALGGHQLVNLKNHNPYFRFEGSQEAFLVREAAVQLSRVQRDLAKEGIALIILRAYLPEYQSPSCFTDVNQDRISRTFSRGTAVDVSMEYLSGNPLQLPCPPYSFVVNSDCGYDDAFFGSCNSCALQILERIMMRHGFIRSEKVWWHFEYRYWTLYPPLDIPIEQLIYSKSTFTQKG